jgi:transcriptional regulator
MYIPAYSLESDPAKLHDFIEANSFGLLIAPIEGRPVATHLPLLLDRHAGPHGCLIGHMARANPHWQAAAGQEVLTVFSGPHAYISPTWYQSEQVVPTWNYVAVHATGLFQLIEDRDALVEIIRHYVDAYERAQPQPWQLDDLSTFTQRMLTQIVGFRIPIQHLEGKWKLGQNHPAERRRHVIRALREKQDENSMAIAALMEERLESSEPAR